MCCVWHSSILIVGCHCHHHQETGTCVIRTKAGNGVYFNVNVDVCCKSSAMCNIQENIEMRYPLSFAVCEAFASTFCFYFQNEIKLHNDYQLKNNFFFICAIKRKLREENYYFQSSFNLEQKISHRTVFVWLWPYLVNKNGWIHSHAHK